MAVAGGRRILIVEDELLIGMLLEDMLVELGYQVAGSASRVEDALKLASETELDAAILDVNLHGKEIYPVADVLAGRKIPFLFATGYGERSLPSAFRQRPTLQKPFQQETLQAKLADLFI